MRVTRLKIKNFRCFGEKETIINFGNFVSFIGGNSCGKTASLQALLKLFGQNSFLREVTRADFHVPKGKSPEDIIENDLYIEAIIEFPELFNEGEIASNTVPNFFERMVVDDTGAVPYVRIRLEAKWRRGNTPEGLIEPNLNFITISETENLPDGKASRQAINVSDLMSNIQMIYVPAVRDPAAQLRNVSGTILWRICNGINWTSGFDTEIKGKIEHVDELFYTQEGVRKIQEVIGEQWSKHYSAKRYGKANIKFNSSDLDSILQKVEVNFSPTEVPGAYKIDELGEGLRSVFYLSLVSSLLEIEGFAQKQDAEDEAKKIFNFNPPALTILAVEEPENHVAPHMLGKIVENLEKISKQPNAQVILTSHSVSIVKRVDAESIQHYRMNEENHSVVVNPILLPPTTDDAYKYIKEAVEAYPELYFSRLVILGEGDTEELVIPKLLELSSKSLDSSEISVVPLGGRHVNHFWKLLSALSIPYVTLLDLDLGRKGGGWGRIKYSLEQLIDNGADRRKLLHQSSGDMLPEGELEQMHLKTGDEEMNFWLNRLEDYNVFYSTPIDLDFMMLKFYEDAYKSVSSSQMGPNVPDKNIEPQEYNAKIVKSIDLSLKGEGDSSLLTLTEKDKELFIWYVYLFLNRSKPATHLFALSNIDEVQLSQKIPVQLRRLLLRVDELLNPNEVSQLSN